MTRLVFKPIHFKTHPLNDDYSYAASFVYAKDNWDLMYVMERIDKRWHFTRWKDVPMVRSEIKQKNECADHLMRDLSTWCRERGISPFVKKWKESIHDDFGYLQVNEDYDMVYRDPKISIGDIQAIGILQNSHRNSNTFSIVYNTWPKGDYRLAYKVERRMNKWSFGRWTGPHTEVGTIGECRNAIRGDILEGS